MKNLIFAPLAALLSLGLVSARAATTTTPVTLSNTAYTDLGVGPMRIAAAGGTLVYQIADSLPSSTVGGTAINQGSSADLTCVTAHVWARSTNAAAGTAIVTAGTGLTCGGGGGGGGGAATIADGADVTEGAQADAAYSGSGSATVVAALKGLYAKLAASLPLPTGAATSANQTNVQSAPGASQTTAVTIQGNASGVAVPVTVSNTNANGQATSANSSPIVIASDQSAVAVKAASGAIASGAVASGAIASGAFASGSISANAAASGAFPAGAITDLAHGQGAMAASVPVAIASDQSALTLKAAATGGASPTGNIAANNTTAVVLKASAGTVYGGQLGNIGSVPAYLKIYNATSATCGSGTPIKRLIIPVAATAANGAGSNVTFGAQGIALGTGITYCVTTGITDADTTAPAANTVLINLDWN